MERRKRKNKKLPYVDAAEAKRARKRAKCLLEKK